MYETSRNEYFCGSTDFVFSAAAYHLFFETPKAGISAAVDNCISQAASAVQPAVRAGVLHGHGSLPIKKGIATPVLGLIEKILPMLKQNLFSGNTGAALDTVHKAAYGVSGEGWRGYLQNMLAGDFCSALYAVWIAGAAGFGIYFFYSYRKENQMLAQAIPLKNMQTDYKAPGDLLKLYDNARNLAGRKQLKINTRYERSIFMTGYSRLLSGGCSGSGLYFQKVSAVWSSQRFSICLHMNTFI